MPLRIGFVGCGTTTGIHIKNLIEMAGVKIVALCDILPLKAEKEAEKINAHVYSDYKKMFHKEKLDACYVCIPPFAHSCVELLAAKKGIHLFIEKPIGINIDEVKKVEQAIKKNGIIVSVGYVFRYLDIVKKMKELLADQKIALAYGQYFGGVVPLEWWSMQEKSGGQIVEQTTHIVDLVRYLIGDIDMVFAQGYKHPGQSYNFDFHEASSINLHFKNSAIGSINSTCLLSGWSPKLEIIAKNMHLKIRSLDTLEIIVDGKIETIPSKVNGYWEEDIIFINSIKNRDDSNIKCSYSDALKTLEVTLAANKSINTGEIIYL
jgi:predicted dehydrogenase